MHSHMVIVHKTIIKVPVGRRSSDFKHYSCKKNHFPWGQEKRGRMAGYTDLREHLRGRVTRDKKTRLLRGSSRRRAEVRAAFTAGKAGESVGQKQTSVGGGEAGLLHPQTRKLSGGWGGTGPPRRVHHRTFSPRPPPSCRNASSSPRSSCICPPLAERSRARAAPGLP